MGMTDFFLHLFLGFKRENTQKKIILNIYDQSFDIDKSSSR